MALGRLTAKLVVLSLLVASCTQERHGAEAKKRRHSVDPHPTRKVPDESKEHALKEPAESHDGLYWPERVGLEPSRHDTPGPNYKSYYNSIYLELIDLPQQSDQLLSQVLLGGPIPQPQENAKRWLQSSSSFMPWSIAEGFMPSGRVKPLAFPSEGGVCDVIRARYRYGKFFVELSATRHLLSMRITGVERGAEHTAIQLVSEFSHIFFEPGAKDLAGNGIEFHWMQINDADGSDPANPAYGCHDIRRRRHSPHDHWADKMNWWVRPGEIGFISTKGQGVMTQHFPSGSEEYNKTWFDKPY